MKTDEIVTIGLLFITMVLGLLVSVRFNRKRDERQAQAFLKALEFTSITSIFIALIGGCIFISKENFNIPIMYIFILIIINFTLMLLMYELNLLIERLELPFILNMNNDRKVKFYSILLTANFALIFFLMACQIYISEVRQINHKNFSPYTIGLFICLYIEAVILHKMPKEEKKIKERNKKATLMIICTLASIIVALVSGTFFYIISNY